MGRKSIQELRAIIDSFKLPDNYAIIDRIAPRCDGIYLQVSIYDRETAQVGLQYAYIKFKALETVNIRTLLSDMVANVEYHLKK